MSPTTSVSAPTSTGARPPLGVRERLGGWGTHVLVAVGSVWATWVIVAVFAAQAGLLAVSLRESLYDEAYHLKAIGYFADGGSPWGTQPGSLTGVGDLERYGSYLYHWLFSYPWRWTDGLADDTRRTVLRLLTVLLVSGALLAIRRLGRALGLSGLASNIVVLIVAAVPMTTFLAVTVNYDNLAFLLLPLMWIPAVRLLGADRIDGYGWTFFLLAAAGLSLSKYSMLPLVGVTGIAVIVAQVRVLRRTRSLGLDRWRWRPGPVAALVAVVIAVAALVERYGVNLLRFRAVQPDCADVQTVRICRTWGPWGRNYNLDRVNVDDPFTVGGLIQYVTHEWVPRTLSSWSLFPVGGEEGTLATTGPHILGTALVVGVVGTVLLIVLAPRAALARPGGLTLFLASAAYLVILVSENFSDYLDLGEVVAVQGRYLQPVMVPLLLLAARALTAILAMNGRPVGIAMRWGGLVLLVFGLSQTAGLIGILARSEPEWFRESRFTPAVLEIRDRAERIVIGDELVPDLRTVAQT